MAKHKLVTRADLLLEQATPHLNNPALAVTGVSHLFRELLNLVSDMAREIARLDRRGGSDEG